MHHPVPDLLGETGPIADRMRLRLGDAAYESRPEQVRMAEAVARALDRRSRLLVEAGTGVGKSFAYLVPAILRCIERGEKVVIATSTIALQEQLVQKDIPLLVETLAKWRTAAPNEIVGASGEPQAPDAPDAPPARLASLALRQLHDARQDEQPKQGPPFDLIPVLAKGRGNYLSIRRLEKASRQQDLLLADADARRSLHAIEDWATTTQDGSLSTLPVLERPEVWDHVRSDTDNCMGRKCPTHQQCFYQEARRKLESANLIVCNHALFFADFALRTRYSAETEAESGAASRKPTNQIKAILPNYHHVIFDEAHGLEDAACEHFGLSLSMPRVLRLLRTLYSPRRRKGYLLDRSLQVGDAHRVDRAITIVGQAEHACQEFFEDLLAFWRSSKDGAGRLRAPNLIENPLTPIMRELAVSLRRIREEIEDESERFELQSLARRASEIAECAHAMVAQTLGADDTGASAYAYWVEVEGDGPRRGGSGAVAGSAGGAVAGGSATATSEPEDDDDHTAWQPTTGRRRFGPRVTLSCAPIHVADLLRRHLFGDGAELREAQIDDGSGEDDAPSGPPQWYAIPGQTPPTPDAVKLLAQAARQARKSGLGIVLTSATLATKQTKTAASAPSPRVTIEPATPPAARASPAFSHAMSTLGIDHAETLQLGSPFDYRTQAKVVIDLTIPDPRARPAPRDSSHLPPHVSHLTFNDALASRVLTHIEATDAGAFVLFTSFATMYACADRLSEKLAQRRWPMLVQGRDGSRQALLHRFLQHESAVLFGAASFWQGVDVRGERLRNVIITRLPFEPPDRPLVQARSERIELCGGNPFMQDSLPRAIIRFKQGFGRLIRSKTDRGQVVVLDPRLVTARYGRMFLDALPAGVPIETIDHAPAAADTRAESDGIRFEPEF